MTPRKKKTALITGGAGFIGSFLAEELLTRGFKVNAVDDLSTGSLDNIIHLKKNPNYNFEVGTILDESLMDRLVSGCDIFKLNLKYSLLATFLINDNIQD